MDNSPDLYLYDIIGGGVCDGMKATEAILKGPYTATVNSKGETILLDGSHRIRKIDVNGVISTIAGTGDSGFSGDNGPAISANLNNPLHLIINDQDEIIFSDNGNHRVRKVLSNGTIITIAGTGATSPFTDNVEATSATLCNPSGLALNSQGELLIADYMNGRVRKLLTNGTMITIAGNPTSSKSENVLATDANIANPYYVAVSSSDEIYISENNKNTIRKILTNGNMIIVGGQGASGNTDGLLATGSKFGFINGLAISNNGSGEVHFIDSNRIRKILNNGKVVTISGTLNTIDFNGDDIDASLAHLNSPFGLKITQENEILFAEKANLRIRKITKDGKIKTIAGNGSNSLCGEGILTATSINLNSPESVAVNSKGEIIFADASHTIHKMARNGFISRIAGTGTSSYNGDGIDATLAGISSPNGIVIDSNNEVIFADSINQRIRKILTNGTIITIAGTGSNQLVSDPILATRATFNTPMDIAIAPNGEIIIADQNNHRVVKILTTGTHVTIAGIPGQLGTGSDGVPSTHCKLNYPQSVAVNSLGEIFIADASNNKIRKILTTGTIITFAGTSNGGSGAENIPAISAYITPGILRFNSNDELIFIDRNRNIIRKISTNGTITTIAGNGNLGYSGNGLKATSSSLFSPNALAVYNGNVVVSDSVNNLIREISTNAICNNIKALDFNVCNGNGQCVDFDTCKCNKNKNYTGNFCEQVGENIVDSTSNNITNSFNNTSLNTTVIESTNSTLNNTLNSDNNTTILNNTLINNNTNVLNNTLIDNTTINYMNNTLNNTLLNSTTNSSSIINNTLINNTVSNSVNNTLNNTLFNNATTNSSSVLNNTLIDNTTINYMNNTLNNTLLNSTTNSSTIVNNTVINNTINNNTLNNTLFNNATTNSSSVLNNTLINNNTNTNYMNNTLNNNTNTNIQTPAEQSSQLIIDPSNNSKNYESNYYSYYAFFAFLVIVVIIKIVIITLICICVIKKIKNKKNNNNNNEISNSSKDVELGNVA